MTRISMKRAWEIHIRISYFDVSCWEPNKGLHIQHLVSRRGWKLAKDGKQPIRWEPVMPSLISQPAEMSHGASA